MKKNLLLISNILLYLSGCLLIGTGLLLELRLDEHGSAVAGIDREDWSEFHFIVALIFVGLILLHVILNWAWIAGLFNRKKIIATIAVAGATVAIIGGMLLLPASGGNDKQHGHTERHGHAIDRD